jgi:hypothetical protein
MLSPNEILKYILCLVLLLQNNGDLWIMCYIAPRYDHCSLFSQVMTTVHCSAKIEQPEKL